MRVGDICNTMSGQSLSKFCSSAGVKTAAGAASAMQATIFPEQRQSSSRSQVIGVFQSIHPGKSGVQPKHTA